MKAIDSFSGEFAFLSNFCASPVTSDGKVWPTVEHAFQAAKSAVDAERELIRAAPTPGKAKRLGRKVTLRPDWEDVKESVMLRLVRLKFRQNRDLALRLTATGTRALTEGNRWHDNTWGDCRCDDCAAVRGRNLLGKILMQAREELRADPPDGSEAAAPSEDEGRETR